MKVIIEQQLVDNNGVMIGTEVHEVTVSFGVARGIKGAAHVTAQRAKATAKATGRGAKWVVGKVGGLFRSKVEKTDEEIRLSESHMSNGVSELEAVRS